MVKRETLRLGFTYGHSLEKVMRFMRSIGISVTESVVTRDKHYTAAADLYDYIKLIPVKPRDVETFIEQGLIDAVVCFSDCLELEDWLGNCPGYQTDGESRASIYPETGAESVSIVAVSRKEWKPTVGQTVKIFSEYNKSRKEIEDA